MGVKEGSYSDFVCKVRVDAVRAGTGAIKSDFLILLRMCAFFIVLHPIK